VPFVADGEAAVAGEPGDGAFDLPAVSAEAVAGVDAAAGDARDDAALAQPGPVGGGVVALSARSRAGLRRRGPRRDRIAGRPITIGCRAWLSWVLAVETPTSSGRPFASDSTCSLEPVLPRSTGFGPVSDPPFWPARPPRPGSPPTSRSRLSSRSDPAPPDAASATTRPRSTR